MLVLGGNIAPAFRKEKVVQGGGPSQRVPGAIREG